MANGGKREGAGRKPGIPNKLTRSMKEKAAQHGDKALAKLVELLGSEEESVALKAANDLLDRGFGRPAQTQIHMGDDDGGPLQVSIVKLADLGKS